ncbi:MAG: adenylate kinase family protein [Parcubacteria group bacterium Gr01-1014_24]|nr:MAG: adenylate kinase family protein [Parcubacteria group bacterium Gr01-1014_24]
MLLGDTASGKETQANILKRKYALKFVETGVYSRKLLKEKSKNGDWSRRTTGKGLPLPVPLLKKFLIKEMKNKPTNKNLLFLGGPRLKPEAQLLKKILDSRKENFIVFYLTLPIKEVYKRSLKRRESNVKKIYKVLDTNKLIRARIEYYKNQVSKTVKYFKSLKKLKTINGNQPIPKVTKDVLRAIKECQIAL